MTRNRPVPHISAHEADYIRNLIVFEDEAILAFNKPTGLPSQVRGNRARNLDHLLWAFAKSNGKRPRLVHRLDVGTSGIILAGRTKPDAASLSASLEGRAAQKTYLAIVCGELPNAQSGRIDAAIARVEEAGRSRIIAGHPEGKPALTHWRILQRVDSHGLVELRPETGRMHQLRVHMAKLGCPIIGDTIYQGAPASRLALHAAEIALSHPRSGEPITLCAPMPEDFVKLADRHGFNAAVFEPSAKG